jgi:hypothetical protein
VLHHQDGEAAKRYTRPEDIAQQVGAKKLRRVEDGSNDAQDQNGNPCYERARAKAVYFGRNILCQINHR